MAEELLKPGHLSKSLEDDLSAEISRLSLPEVIGVTESLLLRLRSHRDACPPQHLEVRTVVLTMRDRLPTVLEPWKPYTVVRAGSDGGLQGPGPVGAHAVRVLGAGTLVFGSVSRGPSHHGQTTVCPRQPLY